MKLRSLAVVAVILATLAPAVSGQLPVSSSVGGQSNACYSAPIAAVLGLVASGAFQWCLQAPTEFSRVGDVIQVSSFFSGPALVGSAIVFATATSSGCTVGTITQGANLIGGLGLAWARAPITTTGRTCSVVFQWSTTVGAATSLVYVGFTATTNEETIEAWPTSNVDIVDDTTADGFLTVPVAVVDEITVDGTLTVDVADDTTDDGFLTTTAGGINATFGNLTIPASLNVSFPPTNGSPGLDKMGTLLFWIAALLFFTYMGWLFAAGFTIPGLLYTLFPTQIPFDFDTYLVLCLLGLVLEVASQRFQWGPYRKSGAMT